MKKITVSILLALLLSACVSADLSTNSDENLATMTTLPQDRESAAQFLASNKGDNWLLLLNDDGAGNVLYAHKNRMAPESLGVSAVWLKVVFPQPIALSAQSTTQVAGSLVYAEVMCSDNSYRGVAYYAVGVEGEILDRIVNEGGPFSSLDAGAVGTSVYRLACESQ